MKKVHLPRGIYDTEIIVLFGKRDEINRYFKRVHNHNDERIAKGICGQHCVWVPDNPRRYTKRYISIVRDSTTGIAERRHTLIHEIIHCALSVFDDKGVKYSDTNDEHLAYFVEWLYREAEKVLA